MLLSLETLMQFFETVAVLALIPIAYGTLLRWMPEGLHRSVVIGLIFSAGSVIALLQPVTMAPGVHVDMRHLPIAFAGAFAGPVAMAVNLTIAAAMRIWMGGAGVLAGVAGMIVAGSMGLLWGRLLGNRQRSRPWHLLCLGAMISLHVLPAFFLPLPLALAFLAEFAPYMVAINVVASVFLGTIFLRERALMLSERTLADAADHDALTGLLNRRGFARKLDGARERPAPRVAGTVMVIDVDRFKSINDRFGHDAGDAVLKILASRLAAELRDGDVLGRFGGEEFVVFAPGAGLVQGLTMAERLRRGIGAAPFRLPGREITVTASIGVHFCKQEWEFEDALARADAALYVAKGQGRDCVVTSGGPVGPNEEAIAEACDAWLRDAQEDRAAAGSRAA